MQMYLTGLAISMLKLNISRRQFILFPFTFAGWLDWAMMQGHFHCILLIWMKVGLSVGVGGGCLSHHFCFLSLFLWEMALYRLNTTQEKQLKSN